MESTSQLLSNFTVGSVIPPIAGKRIKIHSASIRCKDLVDPTVFTFDLGSSTIYSGSKANPNVQYGFNLESNYFIGGLNEGVSINLGGQQSDIFFQSIFEYI